MMLLGCIGDDFTGSSDLANTLAKEGMRVTQYCGIPSTSAASDVEAGVVSLKSRSISPVDAVRLSLEALEWLKAQGCRQFLFKYCSTFDSTPAGNIGSVAEALALALGANQVIVCPAFPATGRSIYQGHLFVNDRLLSESGMQNHPLTPMTDPDIRRWLGLQTTMAVGHVAARDVLKGASAIRSALQREQDNGKRLIVVDALQDQDLREIGSAAAELPLLSGGSGIALGLPENFRKRGEIGNSGYDWKGRNGKCVVLSGSCSIATRGQLAAHFKKHPSLEIVPAAVIGGRLTPLEAANWALASDGIPALYSSADSETVKSVQAEFGMAESAHALEAFFAETARLLVEGGVERLIAAGGETSGAVIEGLGLADLALGPEIDPGVPALRAGPDLVVALKSGNFGSETFFEKAAAQLGNSHE